MAIYDRPDGSPDPRPRCTGHCCRGFSIEQSYAFVQSEAERLKLDPLATSSIPDVGTIAEMLVPLGHFRGQDLFTCRHLSKAGNCTIYESRPQMCRDFPGPSPCPYKNCSSHGPQPLVKRAINWLRE